MPCDVVCSPVTFCAEQPTRYWQYLKMTRSGIKKGDVKWSSFLDLQMTHAIMCWSILERRSQTMGETKNCRIWVSFCAEDLSSL